MLLGNKIAELRKEKGMTQEALANALGVSNQAVSKWEANQSCPDIQLLPQIADFFGVSLDSLFGREVHQEEKDECDAPWVPWEDDGKLRAVIYIGKRLVMAQDCTEAKEISFEYEGDAMNIESSFSVICNDVQGNISAGGDVECNDVAGHVKAGGDVECNNVDGWVTAGGDVSCDAVAGNIKGHGDVTSGDVMGDVSANGDVTCDRVGGNVMAKGDVNCDYIKGCVEK